jgi:hypothetical protein
MGGVSTRVEPQDAANLADELIRRIQAEGIPAGAWLVDISEVRRALQNADALLRRMQEAITRAAQERHRIEP